MAPVEEPPASADQVMQELKFMKVPAVDSAFATVSMLYAFGKDKSRIIPGLTGVIDSTERCVLDAATKLTPLMESHAATIVSIDAFATNKVEKVVDTMTPIVGCVSDNITMFNQRVGDGVTATRTAVTDTVMYIERKVAPSLQFTARVADNVVEAVLPVVVPEGVVDTDTDDTPMIRVSTPELAEAIAKCTMTVSKAKRRAFVHAMTQLATAQTRANTTVDSMKEHSVNLIQYAQTMIKIESQQMTSTHSTAAVQVVESIADATAAYVTAQRELLQTFMSNPTGATRAAVLRAIAKAESIQQFVKHEFESSSSRAAFVAQLEEYRKQAKMVHAELLPRIETLRRGNSAELVAAATELYIKFEDAADPYTLHLLKKIRLQLAAVAARSDSTEDFVVIPRPHTPTPADSQAVADVEPVCTFPAPAVYPVVWNPTEHRQYLGSPRTILKDQPFNHDSEESCTESDDGGGGGLVLRVSTAKSTPVSTPRINADIDLEDVLAPDSENNRNC